MRLFGSWQRGALAAAVSACFAAGVVSVPAHAASAGTVISVLPQPEGWRNVSNGSVVEYWMTGSDGTPKPASGAVLIPPGPAPAGGWPILAFAHGSFGLGPGCGAQSDPARGPWPELRVAEDKFVASFLSKGFAVVAPDYLGLGRFDTGPHPYLELKTEATATIGLIKAARSHFTELSRTWVVLGGSQGGHAALGTAHLHRTYAPELDFRGAIAIDPASDAESLLPMAGPWGPDLPSEVGQALTVFVASVLAGLRTARPDANMDSYLTPRGREVLDTVGRLCQDRMVEGIGDVGISQLLSKPLTNKHFQSVLADYLGVPTSGYDAPILLLINATDISVPSPLHAALAARFTVNRVDYKMVVGTGRHLQINREMHAAIDAFLARIQPVTTGQN
ncbi:lipase family protein [Nocardia sp. XZ_19_369]|uniref:lipase family protein n=1 Tax=Nocardia sp. XZ_19_369 TaxID=2769487 RepID=UPI0018905E87|nr:alpha/beta fold hydrolase [Nocardia sp. XZ_19_369]